MINTDCLQAFLLELNRISTLLPSNQLSLAEAVDSMQTASATLQSHIFTGLSEEDSELILTKITNITQLISTVDLEAVDHESICQIARKINVHVNKLYMHIIHKNFCDVQRDRAAPVHPLDTTQHFHLSMLVEAVANLLKTNFDQVIASLQSDEPTFDDFNFDDLQELREACNYIIATYEQSTGQIPEIVGTIRQLHDACQTLLTQIQDDPITSERTQAFSRHLLSTYSITVCKSFSRLNTLTETITKIFENCMLLAEELRGTASKEADDPSDESHQDIPPLKCQAQAGAAHSSPTGEGPSLTARVSIWATQAKDQCQAHFTKKPPLDTPSV